MNPPAVPTIVHLDADAFFVACEQARDPKLVGTACAVGGRERGIISSASYEARARGVFTPMPTSQALRVCPELILIRHTPGLYGSVSRSMFDICETLTPIVQRNSIDEGYLDLGPCRLPTVQAVEAAVRELQGRILRELGIPVSMGIASNRLVAQVASKLRKPRGFVVVLPGEEAAFLAPLGVGRLPGIGVKTEAELAGAGIRTVGDLLGRGERELAPILGNGWISALEHARGVDNRPVETHEEDAKSYSRQETFGTDVVDFGTVERVAKGMIDELMAKIRSEGARVRTLTVTVRRPDFSQDSRGQSLREVTDIEAPFYPLLGPLLRAAWGRARAVRLVGVRFSGVGGKAGQMELFTEGEERRRRLAGVLDRLNRGETGPIVTRGHQLPSEGSDKATTRRPRRAPGAPPS